MQTRNKPTVTVLIPALNEGKLIKKIIRDCFGIKQYIVDVLVVIDCKTSDNTEQEAKKNGARVIWGNEPGKGSSVKYALGHLKGDYVIQIDSDYQFIPQDIPKMIEPLINGYDVTLGTRYQKGSSIEKGSVTLFKLIGSFILSLLTSLCAWKLVTDVMAGFKGFKTSVLKDLNPQVSHFGYEAELVIRASQKKYKIKNIPITYRKRASGRSSVNSIKHGFLVLGTIIKTALN